MKSLSVVLSVYNAEETLERVLVSVAKLAEEIIVVDNSSSDKTAEIAMKHTKFVYKKENNMMLNVNKNFGFSKAKSDWVLSLDGDEEIPPEVAEEIRRRIESAPADIWGFWMPRKNIIFGKWIRYGLWWPDMQLRLFRRGLGKFPGKHVHEYLQVEGKTERLIEAFIHYNYNSISQFIKKMDSIYTENEVTNLLASGYVISWADAIKFPISDFVKVYFSQSGWKDGLHGLVLSMLQAFYSFVVFTKLWERSGFKEKDIVIDAVSKELVRAGREINYWRLTTLLQTSTSVIKKVYIKIMRKLVL